MSPSIVVIPGGGTQGRATCAALTKQGFEVHALVRNPDSASSQQLQTLGTTLHKGSLDDVASIKSSLKGAHGLVFSCPAHPMDEQGQASNVITAAVEAGVKHLIYSGAAQTGEHEKFPGWGPDFPLGWYWLNKAAIEGKVRSSGIPNWTILRPAFFMQNFGPPMSHQMFPSLAEQQKLRLPYNPDTRLDLVDVMDIGIFAGEAFQSPERFNGKAIALAGESLTLEELATRLSTIGGKPVEAEYIGEAELAELRQQGWIPANAFVFHRQHGYKVDIEELRKLGVPLRTLDDALSKESLAWA